MSGLEVGGNYALTAWVKTRELGFTPTVILQFYAGNEFLGRAATHEEQPLTGTADWTRVETVFRVPEKTNHAKLRACLRGLENNGGQVWFDDIEIAKQEPE